MSKGSLKCLERPIASAVGARTGVQKGFKCWSNVQSEPEMFELSVVLGPCPTLPIPESTAAVAWIRTPSTTLSSVKSPRQLARGLVAPTLVSKGALNGGEVSKGSMKCMECQGSWRGCWWRRCYRGISRIRNSFPLAPCSRTMPKALGGGGCFL